MSSDRDIVPIHIQAHTLFNRHVREIVNDGQLTDEVMDSYIKLKKKVRQSICCFCQETIFITFQRAATAVSKK